MIRSMTGFGRAQGVLGGKDITVEIRSVNHRYFEFSARLPRAYSWLEEKLKGVAQGAASRGKVEVSLLIQTVEGSDAQVVVNTALAREYVEALRELGRELDLPDDLSLSAVARFGEIFTLRRAPDDEEEVQANVLAVAAQAAERFSQMRRAEGEKLREDILGRLISIEERVAQVEERSPQTVAEYRQKLTARMEELLGKAAVEEKRRQAEELRRALPFPTRREAEAKIAALRAEEAALQKGIQDAQTRRTNLEKRRAEERGRLETYQAHLRDGEDVDLERAGNRKTELAQEKETLERESGEVQTRLTLNGQTKKDLLRHLEELEERGGRLTWLKALSDTANGALTGQERFRLETYIQTTFLARVLRRANLRLRVMSGGQYDLIRRVEAGLKGQVGLDLDVVDHWNGTVRGVETLSGGESFLASLALALGLADEIQSSAGGVQLDTMFVDEGFGSLDDEALQKAMQALSQLGEGRRLVGIISHVAGLKERIDRQIVVKKDRSGGSRAEVVC